MTPEEQAWETFQLRIRNEDPGDCTCIVHPLWVNRGTPDSHFETETEYDPLCPIHGRQVENDDRCPLCEQHDLEDHVEFKNGRPHCTRHGCTFVAGEWVYLCEKCGEEVEALYGWPTPAYCEDCLKTFHKCSKCGAPLPTCCC